MIEFRKSSRHSSCISCGSTNEMAEVLFRRSADSNAHALTLCKECRSKVASLPSPDYQRGQEEVIDCGCGMGKDCMRATVRALPAQQESVCEWKGGKKGTGLYAAECAQYGYVTNFYNKHMRFCPYCGRPIKLAHKGKEEG